MNHEYETLISFVSKNGNISQLSSQVNHASVAEMPATVTSPFPVQNSHGESPMSWNSYTNYPFSYNHNAFDFETPKRAPASWNLQPIEVEATRVRKKRGIAKISNPISNSSALQSRTDIWQVISPDEAIGYLVVVDKVLFVQYESYDVPTILVAKTMSGEEEIPDDAVAISTPDNMGVLSHVSVHARNNNISV
nr:alpha-glucan water dikinase, chloroplastic [Tanacetum cinerariifolium]